MAFNNAVEDLAVEQACAYGIFDSDGQTFLEGLKSYFSAKRFCWTSGNKDNYEYDYDMWAEYLQKAFEFENYD